jgi:phosphatidylglycerophosphate synthase
MKNNLLESADYRQLVRYIRKQQQLKEFFSKYFTSIFSPYVTVGLIRWRVKADVVTLSMLIFGVIAGFFLIQGEPVAYIIAGVSLVLLNLADTCDGELARISESVSNRGDYLDRLMHFATNSIVILCLGYGLSKQLGNATVMLVAIAVEILYTMDDLMRDLLITCNVSTPANVSRKHEKLKSSIPAPRTYTKFLFPWVSNMGLFHLLAIAGVLDYYGVMPSITQININYTLVLFLVFSSAVFLKFLIRVYLIKRIYFPTAVKKRNSH